MRAREIMSSPVITVQPWRPLKEVAGLLLEHSITAVPVVDEQERLVGIITEADLLRLEQQDDPRSHLLPVSESEPFTAHTVEDLMTREVVWVHEQADVAEVARAMLSNRVRSIPVLADGRVVGIITRRDLVRVLARADEDIRIELDDLLDDEIRSIGRFHAVIEGGVVTLTGPTDRPGRRLAKVLARSVPGVVGVRFAKAS